MIKRINRINFILFLLLFLLNFYSIPNEAIAGDNANIILSVPWGHTKGSVGFSPASECCESLGPTSFFVTTNEIIYILDAENKRINLYKNGRFVSEINLPKLGYPNDIYILENKIYYLSNKVLYKMDMSGKLLKEKNIVNYFHLATPWKIYNLEKFLLITDESRQDKIACFDKKTLENTSCRGLDSLFKKYIVFESLPNGDLVVLSNGKLRIMSESEKKGKIISDMIYIHTMYPAVTYFRLSGDMMYILEPSEKELAISNKKISN